MEGLPLVDPNLDDVISGFENLPTGEMAPLIVSSCAVFIALPHPTEIIAALPLLRVITASKLSSNRQRTQ